MSGINNITDRSDIQRVLAEMRNMRSQMQRPEPLGNEPKPQAINSTTKAEPIPSFGSMLTRAVDSVNETQMKASALSSAYEQGDPTVDITRVMIQSQKASVSFQALTQVRNKVVQAYEDIMKMPI